MRCRVSDPLALRGLLASVRRCFESGAFCVFLRKWSSEAPPQLLLSLHDELIFQCKLDDLEQLKTLVVKAMTADMPLRVPLSVSLKFGESWGALQPLAVPEEKSALLSEESGSVLSPFFRGPSEPSLAEEEFNAHFEEPLLQTPHEQLSPSKSSAQSSASSTSEESADSELEDVVGALEMGAVSGCTEAGLLCEAPRRKAPDDKDPPEAREEVWQRPREAHAEAFKAEQQTAFFPEEAKGRSAKPTGTSLESEEHMEGNEDLQMLDFD